VFRRGKFTPVEGLSASNFDPFCDELQRLRRVVDELRERGIIIKSPSMHGVAEDAPGAYKDNTAVVEAHLAGLSRKVATLEPLICIKG
jgi:tRNA-splicing ligase RtcB (3'-phosphate/5'-hydroxy nucleic acid ligase)